MVYVKKKSRNLLSPRNLILCIVVLICLVSLTFAAFQFTKNNEKVVMTLNEQKISKEQYELIMNSNIANTVNYFKQTYNLDYSKSFWTTKIKDETPLDYIIKATVKDLTLISIQNELLDKYKINSYSSYSEFLKLLDKENKRREEAVKNKQVIFGPKKYGEREYYNYLLSNNLIKLKDLLVKDETIKVTDDILKDYFSKNPNIVTQSFDTIKISKITLTYVDSKGNVNKDLKNKNLEILNAAKSKLDKGADFSTLAKEINLDKNVLTQTFDDSTARMDSKLNELVFNTVQKLNPGQTSDVLDENGAYSILKIEERVKAPLKTFEESKEQVKARYVDEKFEELINKNVSTAKVEYNAKGLPKPEVN